MGQRPPRLRAAAGVVFAGLTLHPPDFVAYAQPLALLALSDAVESRPLGRQSAGNQGLDAMTNQTGDEMNGDTPKVLRIIELKLPLTWLLGVAGIALAALLAFYMKVDGSMKETGNLSAAINRLEQRSELRDSNLSQMVNTTIRIESQMTAQGDRLSRTEQDMRELRSAVEEVRKGQRYMPR